MVILVVIFGIISALFFANGFLMEVNSAIHQIYQSMQYILGTLWIIASGIIILIIKNKQKKIQDSNQKD